ncbi:hypothetical protein GCM10007856_57200 [Azospirillum oryzae]|nr:hypothetical protein GCM10007856_57200 [Azospirillum oryzae]
MQPVQDDRGAAAQHRQHGHAERPDALERTVGSQKPQHDARIRSALTAASASIPGPVPAPVPAPVSAAVAMTIRFPP